MCKICIARRLVVDTFPRYNANFVPFPSRTLVAGQMQYGRIGGSFILRVKNEMQHYTVLTRDHVIYGVSQKKWTLKNTHKYDAT